MDYRREETDERKLRGLTEKAEREGRQNGRWVKKNPSP